MLRLTDPQFDGKSDTRGPLDFSTGSPGKLDDITDGDDDDLDGDDALDPSLHLPPGKRTGNGKLKQELGLNKRPSIASPADVQMSVDIDYQLHRPAQIRRVNGTQSPNRKQRMGSPVSCTQPLSLYLTRRASYWCCGKQYSSDMVYMSLFTLSFPVIFCQHIL